MKFILLTVVVSSSAQRMKLESCMIRRMPKHMTHMGWSRTTQTRRCQALNHELYLAMLLVAFTADKNISIEAVDPTKRMNAGRYIDLETWVKDGTKGLTQAEISKYMPLLSVVVTWQSSLFLQTFFERWNITRFKDANLVLNSISVTTGTTCFQDCKQAFREVIY